MLHSRSVSALQVYLMRLCQHAVTAGLCGGTAYDRKKKLCESFAEMPKPLLISCPGFLYIITRSPVKAFGSFCQPFSMAAGTWIDRRLTYIYIFLVCVCREGEGGGGLYISIFKIHNSDKTGG